MKRTKIILLLMLSFLALGKTATAQNPEWPNINPLPPICEGNDYSQSDYNYCLHNVDSIRAFFYYYKAQYKRYTSWIDIDNTTNLSNGDSVRIILRNKKFLYSIYDTSNSTVVIINPHSNVYIDTTVCDIFFWSRTGGTYTGTGDYRYTQPGVNINGCDSIYTLRLTVNHSTTTILDSNTCDSLVWHGATYHTGGHYPWNTTNVAGCDSTVTLRLTVSYSTHNSFTETACDSYTWHSIPRTTSAVYTYDYTNLAGCQSTDTLHLTIHYSSATTLTETACDRYVWNDSIYTRSTITSVTTFNSHGCDSTITLHLTVNYSSTATDVHDVCDSLRWHGVLYRTSTNLPTYSTTNAAGCDSTVTLDLTVRYASHEHLFMTTCESYTWERTGQVYTMSGLYPSDTYTNAVGCPSIDTLHLVVYGAAIPEQRELVVKNLGTGSPQMIIYPRTPGEKEYAYQWYRDSNIIEGAQLQYYRFGKEDKGKHTFSVYVSPIEQKLCGATSSVRLTVKPSVKSFLAVSPNPAKESFTVNLTAEDEQMAEVSIFTAYGTCVITLPTESDNIQVSSMLPKGVYMLRVTTTQGNIYTDKLIVQ